MTDTDRYADRELDVEHEIEAPVVPYLGDDRTDDVRDELAALRTRLDRIEATLSDR
ncbi:hypothetical protein ACFQJD_14190 [Haloplanus sp. GCM10025708]|uniref:hypothetical protein n=1 Tax=Haloferacaceae TaxID=1644056 RepID=UPI0036170189